MIVLHAGVNEGRFLLWGETPLEAPVARPRARRSKEKSTSALPYDAGVEQLSTALREAGCDVSNGKHSAEVEHPFVWLPTVDSQPFASSVLIAESPQTSDETVLTPWAVTALRLSTEQAIDLLCSCVGKQVLAPGVIVGNDLAFWAKALHVAGALVARQQFLPEMSEGEGGYHARWKPLFLGADAQLLTQFSRTMPHVCRACTPEKTIPPVIPPTTVLSGFLDEMVDALIRLANPQRLKPVASFASLHDQWLYRLHATDGTMKGETSELHQLASQVREWQRPVLRSTVAPFHLCFRLEEPVTKSGDLDFLDEYKEAGVETWYVRYLLQAADDPSLLIPADDAWRAKGSKATLLTRGEFNVREYLLSSLGQAAGICPRIERSLKTSTPGGYELDATGAYEFLTEKAMSLEQAGFGVLLPAWWTRKGTKLRLTARASVTSPKMRGNSGLSLDSIAQFQWQVALGDEVLSLEELTALAKLKQPLVRIRGQWVQLNAEEIQAALDFWKKSTNKTSVREIVRMALGANAAPSGLAFAGVTATGWVADLLAQLDGRETFAELKPPVGFHGVLRPYQVRGYSWLSFLRRWGLGACLADDMGLGKTIQTLNLIQRDWETNGKRPVLLICPTSVVSNWRKEAARFTPDLPVSVHHGLTRTKSAEFKAEAQQQAIVISSYALLHRDFDIFKQVPWAGVILDEAQNIKNAETKQAKAARALPADYRVALTGTPVENNVGDLWSLQEFLNPGFLGSQAEFKRTFFVPIQANRDPEAATRLKQLTGPFILRRLKTDKSIIADLPEKMEMKVFCTLTKEQASLYAAVVKEAEPGLEEAAGIQRRGMILGILSKLKQVCNHPAQFLGDNSEVAGRSGKLARLTEMLEEVLAIGDRALIFSQFAEMGALLQRHLQATFGREVLFLHGGVSKPQRDRMVERFQADGDSPPIFILSLKAGGTGLNLTRANHVFHFDRWWNPAVENQATDRAFRIGQTKNVQVHKFLCVGTLEEKIDEMIERKKDVAEQVVGTGESWLTELSTAELKDLFALRQEAIGE